MQRNEEKVIVRMDTLAIVESDDTVNIDSMTLEEIKKILGVDVQSLTSKELTYQRKMARHLLVKSGSNEPVRRDDRDNIGKGETTVVTYELYYKEFKRRRPNDLIKWKDCINKGYVAYFYGPAGAASEKTIITPTIKKRQKRSKAKTQQVSIPPDQHELQQPVVGEITKAQTSKQKEIILNKKYGDAEVIVRMDTLEELNSDNVGADIEKMTLQELGDIVGVEVRPMKRKEVIYEKDQRKCVLVIAGTHDLASNNYTGLTQEIKYSTYYQYQLTHGNKDGIVKWDDCFNSEKYTAYYVDHKGNKIEGKQKNKRKKYVGQEDDNAKRMRVTDSEQEQSKTNDTPLPQPLPITSEIQLNALQQLNYQTQQQHILCQLQQQELQGLRIFCFQQQQQLQQLQMLCLHQQQEIQQLKQQQQQQKKQEQQTLTSLYPWEPSDFPEDDVFEPVYDDIPLLSDTHRSIFEGSSTLFDPFAQVNNTTNTTSTNINTNINTNTDINTTTTTTNHFESK